MAGDEGDVTIYLGLLLTGACFDFIEETERHWVESHIIWSRKLCTGAMSPFFNYASFPPGWLHSSPGLSYQK